MTSHHQQIASKRSAAGDDDTASGDEASLIELLGYVGDFAAELEAYQLHFVAARLGQSW